MLKVLRILSDFFVHAVTPEPTLRELIRAGNFKAAKTLANSSSKEELTYAFREAVLSGNFDMVIYLLNRGADPTAKTAYNHESILTCCDFWIRRPALIASFFHPNTYEITLNYFEKYGVQSWYKDLYTAATAYAQALSKLDFTAAAAILNQQIEQQGARIRSWEAKGSIEGCSREQMGNVILNFKDLISFLSIQRNNCLLKASGGNLLPEAEETLTDEEDNLQQSLLNQKQN